ncbi:MAG TPA: UDP-N-acetylmuramoyl-L-alanyl-D-glutamate--2,6-diaminopimelate ligase [Gammaproteobacteria bacterium]|nr:UDP-N-acetylmuramoyl-L-alanyl-D-glutamate--2,6-diaminopimelate ligase [Gammaproteobacteria bacterium]HAS49941.1 UDP-N-acetylmuramoyl-L-alanyl-D-glutamate--2,6-diaminopimelate ligase [Gammaproteobacteria bacterium]
MNTAEQLNFNGALLELLSGLATVPDPAHQAVNVVVTGIQLDSRMLRKGDLFLACFGRNHDAREFIGEAIKTGVTAVLAETGGQWQGTQIIDGIAVIAVDNLSAKLSEIAARFYGHPSRRLSVIGITGTNGKTSCSQFIAQALANSGFSCGTIGTLGYGVYGKLQETQLTTPDPVFTQMALAEMVQGGIDPVVMEVSSVGLHQKRVKAVKFDTAIFTNLTRDHLDYHESMEAYGNNKKKLFTSEGLSRAIINLDDPYALSVINAIAPSVEMYTYSIKNSAATVYAESLTLTRQGFEARVVTPIGAGVIKGKLFGYFNVSNLLAVISVFVSYLPKKKELDIEQLCELVSGLSPVDGRMQIVGDTAEITALVDYAHTPDGLRSALKGLRDHFSGNIWCVFGCGGNRDKGKRPIMGEIAEAFADKVIIADDNPRNEEGDKIVEHIQSGMKSPEQTVVLRDREKAIAYAIGNAEPGDVVLVAGKGHETYQDVGGSRLIFSDANQVRLALQARENK